MDQMYDQYVDNYQNRLPTNITDFLAAWFNYNYNLKQTDQPILDALFQQVGLFIAREKRENIFKLINLLAKTPAQTMITILLFLESEHKQVIQAIFEHLETASYHEKEAVRILRERLKVFNNIILLNFLTT